MNCTCPFVTMLGVDPECVYISDGGTCAEIESAPGNSDAWCFRLVVDHTQIKVAMDDVLVELKQLMAVLGMQPPP